MRRTLTITNQLKQALVVYTEPEGQDFWLLPGDTFELAADVASADDKFIVEDLPNGFQVWLESGTNEITVWDRGSELKCGHQRPPPETTWWLNWSALPERLFWARLQVADDGSATVFDLDGKYHAFPTRQEAMFWLSEDEYSRLDNLQDNGEVEPELIPPVADCDESLLPLMLVDRLAER